MDIWRHIYYIQTNTSIIYKLTHKLKQKSGLQIHTQLGAEPDWPSQPMCATCLTSVGYPISISLSFTTATNIGNFAR